MAKCEFQFHKGTIRTEEASFSELQDHDFNSIKVQLEQVQNRAINARKWDFNSIKVQLEPSSSIMRTCPKTFQFHKGTIRTKIARQTSV